MSTKRAKGNVDGTDNEHRMKEDHAHGEESPPVSERAVVINIARTIEALRGPFVTAPAGLSREEKRQFILSHAK